MKSLFCVFAALFIFFYLSASKMDWFIELARSSRGRNPLFSQPVNLTQLNKFVWTVPKGKLPPGQAQLSLVVNLFLLREIPSDRSQVQVRATVSAFANRPDGKRENRWIKNDYYKTDKPFSEEGRGLWESYGQGRYEFGLGAVDVRKDEGLTIEFSITTPDPGLASGNPRLKLVGDHDPAGIPWEFLVQDILVDWGFYISLILLFLLVLVAWGQGGPKKVENKGERKGDSTAGS
jgi:hypothetical protein